MTENRRTVQRAYLAPACIAVGIAWVAVIAYVVIGRVIIRETEAGFLLARWIERLPSFLSKPVFTVSWYVFFLGWTVPLVLGIKFLFRRNSDNASQQRRV